MWRVLFSGQVPVRKVKVDVQAGRFKVQIGSIHGVISGAEFTLESPDSGVVLRADSVSIDSSILVLKEWGGDRQPSISPNATVSSWRNPGVMLKVFVEGLPKATVEALFPSSGPSSWSHDLPTLLMPKYKRVASRDLADAWVVRDTNGFAVTTKHPLLPTESYGHAISNVARLPLILNAIADFNFYLGHGNGAPEVTMGLFRVSEEGYPPILVPDKRFNNYLQGNKAMLPNVKGAKYGISIVNGSERSLFPYLFYFNPEDCGIKV
jgi:hypothetical protein